MVESMAFHFVVVPVYSRAIKIVQRILYAVRLLVRCNFLID